MTFMEHLVSVAEHTCEHGGEDVQTEPTSHYELSAGRILMKQTVKLCNYRTLPQVNTQVNELGGSLKLMHCNKLESNSSCTGFVQSLHGKKGCLAMNLACPCHLLLPL